MDIVELLKSAQEKVNKAQLDQEFRAPAFSKVFDLLSDGQSVPKVGQATTTDKGDEGLKPAVSSLETVGRRMGVAMSVLSEAMLEEDGEVSITVPPSKLAKSKQAATRQLSMIAAAARQAAEMEEWTSVAILRRICDDYGKADPPNFAAAISGMDEIFQFRGKGQSREVRVRKPGYEAAGRLLKELFPESAAGQKSK